ncbi:MAG: tetratricopeptide repeat-containing sensor histidine kinase [Melioribacteraceae bacterium]|nr:tetratricopeptide repeat-containing sensor histidine kinase [Melioribacteraceae bacterium]
MNTNNIVFVLLILHFLVTANSFAQKDKTKSSDGGANISVFLDSLLAGTKTDTEKKKTLQNYIDSDSFNTLHYNDRTYILEHFLKNPQVAKNDSLFLHSKVKLVLYKINAGNYDDPLQLLAEPINKTSKGYLWNVRAEALEIRAYINKRLDNNEECLADYELLLSEASLLNDLNYEYIARMGLGDYFRKIGDAAKSIPHYYRSDEIAELQNDFVKLDRTNAKIGRMLVTAAEFPKAVEYFKKSLKYSELIKDSSRIHAMRETVADFSPNYTFEEVLKVSQDRIRFLKTLGQKKDLSKSHDLCAKYYYRLGDYDSSYKYSQIALEYAIQGKQTMVIVYSYYRMGLIEFHAKKYEKALLNYKKAEQYYNSEERPGYGDFLYEGMGECYSALGQHPLAKASFKKAKEAKELTFKLDTKKQLAINFARYSINKEKKKEFEDEKAKNEAILTERNYIILSLIGTTFTVVLVLVFVAKLSRERKTNLQIQNEKNVLIEQQRDELNDLNHVKDRLFSVIAHDLRGPVGNMLRLSKLIVLRSKKNDDVQNLEVGSLLNESAKNINRLLQSLLLWGKVQMNAITPFKSSYPIGERLCEIIKLYEENLSIKRIELINQIDPTHIAYVDDGMIDSVFRNLIHNAVKYSNEEGTITLKSLVEAGMIGVSISDDGNGIKKNIIDEIYNPDGILNEEGGRRSGLGLILAKEFVDLNEGQMKIESELGRGTTITILLPILES